MSEERASYIVADIATVTPDMPMPTHPMISVISETDWESRLCEIVRLLRSQRKDAIILYDQRTNTLRVAPFVQVQSLKAE